MTSLLLEGGAPLLLEGGDFWLLEADPDDVIPSEPSTGSPYGQQSSPTSDRFERTIRSPHLIVNKVQILRNGEVVKDDCNVVGGEVTFDAKAAMYSSARVQLAEPTLIGFSAADLFTPFGNEFRVWSGVQYGDGSKEYVALGTFPIRLDSTDGVTKLSELEGFDRSQRVAWARLEDDYPITAGTNYADAIEALIDDGVSGLTYRFASTSYTTPDLVIARQADRWATAVDMARKIGMRLYFDGLGDCILDAEPDPKSTTPIDTFSEGEGGVLVGLTVELDRESTYNVVCVESSNADADEVFKATAEDDDPASPTYVGGPYGRQPRFYASPFIASNEQAASAARSILLAGLGVPRSVELTVVPNPKRRPGDVIVVKRATVGINEAFVLDTVGIGLGAQAPMTATARTRWETDTTVT